jgi:hypothetical protein
LFIMQPIIMQPITHPLNRHLAGGFINSSYWPVLKMDSNSTSHIWSFSLIPFS